MAERKHFRCAIYTRKSSEEGLEQDFNSLDAQREACAAYIASQKHEGWTELPARYDDGGFSGGNIERPGLVRLLDDIRAKRVDVIVVYKVDRLTRSLADFAKIVEVLDAQGVSFVAVTQQFNTTTSMGRLTLNVLLSFAQFEREIAGERIRDKIKASRQKGMWMGGSVPLGYEVKNRALVVNETEAKKVRLIFRRYVELGSVNALADDLDRRKIRSHRRITQEGRTIGGRPITRGNLYLILQNQVYLGMVVHKGTAYPGLHRPIIEREAWDRVQEELAKNRVDHRKQMQARVPSLLTGLVFDGAGERLTPSHSNRGGLRYRYYISKSLARGRPREDEQGKRWRIPAAEIENAVLVALGSFLDEQSALVSILSLRRLPPAQTARVLKATTAVSRSLSQDHTGQLRSTLQSILSRVEIGDTTLTITVSLERLREAAQAADAFSRRASHPCHRCARAHYEARDRAEADYWGRRYGDDCKRRGTSEGSRASLFVVRRHPHAARQRFVGTCHPRAAHSVVCAGTSALGLPRAEYRGCHPRRPAAGRPELEAADVPDGSRRQLDYSATAAGLRDLNFQRSV